MRLIRYEPWSFLNQIQSEIGRLVGSRGQQPEYSDDTSTVETSRWMPAVDIKEEKDRYALYADIPGVDPKNIEVSMENNVLTIKGEREEEKQEERDNYTRIERMKGIFYRRFTLPDDADGEKIMAHADHGVLEVVIPKKEHTKARKINVVTHQGSTNKKH